MAYLRVTPHYKGHFPLEGGGATFGGYGQKEVTPDSVADYIANSNFPFIVKCDRDGKYLVDVPPVEEAAVPQVPSAPPEAPAPKSPAPAEAGPLAEDENPVPPVIEVVETKKASKKGK